MNNQSENITTGKSAIEMLIVANEFCLFMEDLENKTGITIFEFVHRVLPLMYTKGSLLPDFVVEYPEANMRFVTEEQWDNLFTELRNKFGRNDEFWLIDPLHINETEPLKASLAENLTDIYQSMKDFTLLYQKNTQAARENSLADCKKLFCDHWGYRISNIMPRLHYLLYGADTDDYNEIPDFF